MTKLSSEQEAEKEDSEEIVPDPDTIYKVTISEYLTIIINTGDKHFIYAGSRERLWGAADSCGPWYHQPGNNIRKLISITSFVLLEELWPDTTEEMTGVTNYQLLECSREMFKVVSHEQTDVLSSVNFKYSTPALRLTFPHYTSQVIGLDFLGSPTIQSRDKWSSRDLNDQSFPSKEPKRLQIITFLVFSFQSAAYLVFHSNLTFWANCFLEYLQTLFARQIM